MPSATSTISTSRTRRAWASASALARADADGVGERRGPRRGVVAQAELDPVEVVGPRGETGVDHRPRLGEVVHQDADRVRRLVAGDARPLVAGAPLGVLGAEIEAGGLDALRRHPQLADGVEHGGGRPVDPVLGLARGRRLGEHAEADGRLVRSDARLPRARDGQDGNVHGLLLVPRPRHLRRERRRQGQGDHGNGENLAHPHLLPALSIRRSPRRPSEGRGGGPAEPGFTPPAA